MPGRRSGAGAGGVGVRPARSPSSTGTTTSSWLDALAERVRQWLLDDAHLLVAGDLNVAASDSDVFHPAAFTGSVYVTPQVRDALARMLDAGLVDVDVARRGPQARRFTWWDLGIGYGRDLGMRLDVIAADRALAARLDTTWIDHVERSLPRPSDHGTGRRLPPRRGPNRRCGTGPTMRTTQDVSPGVSVVDDGDPRVPSAGLRSSC